jgi:hypothetical protein
MTDAKRLPDVILQELRALASVHCREICLVDCAEGNDRQGQEQIQEKVFHRSTGYSSVVDQMLSASGAYKEAFFSLPLQNNREGNEKRKECMLQLKTLLSCDEENNFIVHERGFTREAIIETKAQKVQGRVVNCCEKLQDGT